jgi:hypothetical protein
MSKEYKCDICNKIYKTKKTLLTHNKQFHPEIKVENNKKYECIICKKVFDSRFNKYYHQKKCIEPSITTSAPVTTINNTNNYNAPINNTIIVNNYGNNNLEYISEKFKQNLFTMLLDEENFSKPLPKLIENINFNPNHKENNNVRITSDRSKVGFVYKNNKWWAKNKEVLLEEMLNESFKIFKKYYNEMNEKLSNGEKEQFQMFENIKFELKEVMKEEIENIAYIFTLNYGSE